MTKIIKIPFILVMVLFLISGCTSKVPKEDKAQFTATAILPLTGDLSFLGDPGKNALELAKKDLDKKGEVVFTYSLVDSKAEAKEAVTEAIKAVDIDNRKILITTLTGPSLSVRDSMKGKNILVAAIAIHPDLPQEGSPLIRFCYSGKQEADILVDKIGQSKEPVGLIVSTDASTDYQVKNIIIPEFKRRGIEIKFVEWFQVGQKDFKNLVALQLKNKVKRILLLGYGSDFPRVLEALLNTGTLPQLTIYGGIGFVEIGQLKTEFSKAKYVITAPAFVLGLSGEEGKKFREEYKGSFGKEPSYDAAYTYDAVMILAKIIKETKSADPNTIRNAILKKKFSGVTGELRFDNKGESTSTIYLSTFKEGLLVKEQ
ncbi:MAG TPA: hypothetical protein DD713_03295 [Nitrospiraceae bacterium]|nr:hypothetical protein [Nitrospiraceae bacterium]